MQTLRAIVAFAAISSSLLAACGEDEERQPTTDVEGVYAITHWTLNESGCDAEGPTVLEAQEDDHLWLWAGGLGEGWSIFAIPCPDVATCRAMSYEDLSFDGWLFREGSDLAGWTGELLMLSVAPDEEGMCLGVLETYALRAPAAGQLEVRAESRQGHYPAVESGCEAKATARAAAAAGACDTLEVVGAGLVEALP